ncbi:MAG: hypothetical protein PHR92_17050 [Lachnospiraceae bacterium]|nr:hypothetical protein [Lachnospiraceae bacterium]
MKGLVGKIETCCSRIKKFAVIMFHASRTELVLLFGLSIIVGIMGPIALWMSKYFIDELALVLKQHQISETLVVLLGILFGLDLMQTLVSNIADLIQMRLSDKVSIYVTEQVLNKAMELPMTNFDDSSTYNKIRLTIQETPDRCMLIITCIEGIVKGTIQLIGTLFILLRLQWLMGIIPAIFLVPLFWLRFKVSKTWFWIQGIRAEKMRYTDELKNILLKNENIKEMKLFGVSHFLSERVVCSQKNFSKENIANNKKYAKLNILTAFANGIYSFGVKLWIIVRVKLINLIRYAVF